MSKHRPQPLGDQLGGLDPGVLDVDQPTATSIDSGSSAEQLDLGHLAAGELERELVHLRPADVREERPVRPPADGPGAVVAEAHVHADVGIDALDRAGDDVEEVLGLVGVAGEARLVELEEVDARRRRSAFSSALTIGIRASVTALRSG